MIERNWLREKLAAHADTGSYWLNRLLDVVMGLCHEGVITISRAREILGVTLHETNELYAEWLKT